MTNKNKGLFEKNFVQSGPHLNKVKIFEDELSKKYPKIKCIGIFGEWYDITNFIDKHPGGYIILDYVGKDVTTIFKIWHKSSILTKAIESGYVIKTGKKYDLKIDKMDTELLKLHNELIRDGYYKPNYIGYIPQILRILFSMIALFYCVKYFTEMYDKLYKLGFYGLFILFILGLLMQTVWHQAGFVTHDAMHSIITCNTKMDNFIGWISGNVLFGVNSRHWNNNHNIHHLQTNTTESNYYVSDPQAYELVWMQHKNLIKLKSKCYNPDWKLLKLFQQFVVKYQHLTYIPINVLLGRPGIVIDSYINETNIFQFLGLIIHILINYYFIYSYFKSNIDFIILYIIAGGLEGATLHLQLLVSHIDKPFTDKMDTINNNRWFYQQSSVVKDIITPIYIDWWFGGLNYHLVHHTLPRLPRCYYRYVDNKLRNILKKYNIYPERKTFINGLIDVYHSLRNVASMYVKFLLKNHV